MNTILYNALNTYYSKIYILYYVIRIKNELLNSGDLLF